MCKDCYPSVYPQFRILPAMQPENSQLTKREILLNKYNFVESPHPEHDGYVCCCECGCGSSASIKYVSGFTKDRLKNPKLRCNKIGALVDLPRKPKVAPSAKPNIPAVSPAHEIPHEQEKPLVNTVIQCSVPVSVMTENKPTDCCCAW